MHSRFLIEEVALRLVILLSKVFTYGVGEHRKIKIRIKSQTVGVCHPVLQIDPDPISDQLMSLFTFVFRPGL